MASRLIKKSSVVPFKISGLLLMKTEYLLDFFTSQTGFVLLFFDMRLVSSFCSGLMVDARIIMVEELKIVSIRFVPVLEKICVCLGYPLPQYYAKDVLGRAAVVIIELPKADDASERKSLSCEGDSEVTLQASCEIAAKKMALYLVESEKIMVYDVNLEARQAHEHAIQLYDLKKDVFERIAQHRCPADVYDVNPVEGVDWGTKFVRISCF